MPTLRAPLDISRFSPEVEREFQLSYNQERLPLRRVGESLSLVIWLAFSFWDAFSANTDPLFQPFHSTAIAIRFSVAGLLTLLMLYRQILYPYRIDTWFLDLHTVVGFSVMFGGMSIWTILAPEPYKLHDGFTGMLAVMAGGLGLYGVSARCALAMCAVGSSLTLVTIVLCLQQLSSFTLSAAHGYFGAGIFMLIIMVLVVLQIWVIEANSRRGFLDRRMIDQQRQTLDAQREELVKLNHSLSAALDDNARKMQSVLALKDRLHQERESRSQGLAHLISSAVHDLRQPLQALALLITPVRRALSLGQIDQASYLLDNSSRAIQMMQAQLSALLDLSRLEAEGLHPHVTLTDPVAVMAEVVAAHQSAAHASGVSLLAPTEIPPVVMLTDAGFLRRILGNALSNAIKYADIQRAEGAQVRLRLLTQGEHLEISVIDNGIGIPPDKLANGAIFRPFVQAHEENSQALQGVGLGLSIVRRMVMALPGHGCDIASEEGIGTTFRLRIPLDLSAQAPAAAPGPDKPNSARNLENVYAVFVEDDIAVRQALPEILHAYGAHCEVCADVPGFERLLDTMERLPDLVISDYRLPAGQTAVDIAHIAEHVLGELPFIVLSGEGLEATPMPPLPRMTRLRKPVHEDMLVEAIAELMARPKPAPIGPLNA